jgi:hypothetical protein
MTIKKADINRLFIKDFLKIKLIYCRTFAASIALLELNSPKKV